MKRQLVLATAVLMFSLAPPAGAGQYQVKACFGNAAQGPTVNGSWSADMAPDPFVTAYTACPGEGIVTRMLTGPGTAWQGASARHTFTAPPGTRIVSFNANLKFNSASGWYAGFVDSSPSWIWCGPSCTSFGQFFGTSFATNTEQLFAQVTCGRVGGCPRPFQDGMLVMKDITVTVQDDTLPSVAITGGSVTQAGWHSGEQTVQFAASDSAGIRSANVFVDGDGVLRAPITPTCDPGQARPCPDLSETVSLPATSFRSDGSHVVAVQAVDAAGNERWTSQRVSVDRTPPAQPQGVTLDGDGSWRNTNAFSVSWQNPVQNASPIDGARYRLCPVANEPGDARRCVERIVRGREISRIRDFDIPGPGDWRLTLWLQDGAGNADCNCARSHPSWSAIMSNIT